MQVRRALIVALAVKVAVLAGCGGDGEPAGKLYTVKDGKVDAKTLKGWETWRAAGCQRCHNEEAGRAAMGPSLVASLKKLQRDDFETAVLDGRTDKGMPAFGEDQQVADNIDSLYAYLKARSDGAIPPGRLTAIGS
jgi:mono/diheme cytochrome c family protein